MTPEEMRRAPADELVRYRLELLRRPCPACDLDDYHSECTCMEDLAEVDKVDFELITRGEMW